MNDSATAPAVPLRKRLRLGRSMTPLLVGLAAALLSLALVISQTMVAQQEARTRAMKEGDALIAVNEMMAATLGAETGQRGYLLTGNAAYLGPYADARQRLERAMAKLREIGRQSTDPNLRQSLARLDTLAQARFAEMDRTLALAQLGLKDQAIALVNADFGRMQMDLIRHEVNAVSNQRITRRRDAFARADELERRLLPLAGVLSLAILGLVYAGFRAERSRSLAQAEAEQAAALREANERAELLARELNHRVKNLFSVILSIVALSGRKQASSREVVEDIRARIRALSLAHSSSQGGQSMDAVELGTVIVNTMQPYGDDDGARVRVDGPSVELPARMVTPIGLIVHELATNAVKYGALSVPEGKVDIGWEVANGAAQATGLVLSWVESGGPATDGEPEGGASFGSQMIVLAAGQLGGTIEREWPPTGAIVRLKFPLS